MEDIEGASTKALLDRFKQAVDRANECLSNEEYQQAMALYYDASLSADEMTQRFLSLLIKTAPSTAHTTLLVEVLSWRLRYFTAQYDYHLAVAQTLSGLPREEWIARLETILVLSQSLVDMILPIYKQEKDPGIRRRIHDLFDDWITGIRNLIINLRSWGMASAQAARVLEWAMDNEIG
ncbi:MAG: hypothetical protein AM325_003000 [Candidatus Thorarchaeota archaeon SMTZ1-45]|nr:MAG: hypothetical protein AM325_04795 [Candidatus Thorarchaeota archaeon SMTZ1-45]